MTRAMAAGPSAVGPRDIRAASSYVRVESPVATHPSVWRSFAGAVRVSRPPASRAGSLTRVSMAGTRANIKTL